MLYQSKQGEPVKNEQSSLLGPFVSYHQNKVFIYNNFEIQQKYALGSIGSGGSTRVDHSTQDTKVKGPNPSFWQRQREKHKRALG